MQPRCWFRDVANYFLNCPGEARRACAEGEGTAGGRVRRDSTPAQPCVAQVGWDGGGGAGRGSCAGQGPGGSGCREGEFRARSLKMSCLYPGDLGRSPSISETRCSGPEDGGSKVSWGPRSLSGLESGEQTPGACKTIFQGDLEKRNWLFNALGRKTPWQHCFK